MNLYRFSIMLIISFLASCGGETDSGGGSELPGEHRPVVITSNYPLYFFARQIAGGAAEVVLPPIDGDPADWKPDVEAIARMQKADLLILNGAGYEAWLDWVTLPKNQALDTTSGFNDRLIPLQQETLHQHGPGGEHSHKGAAFTVWLDPHLAIEQAKAIESGLAELLPGHAQILADNRSALVSDLELLDESLRHAFEKFGDRPVIFSHPVYQYLAAAYSLNGVSVHWEPEEDPGTTNWIEFGRLLRDHPAKLMMWEDEPLDSTATRLRELGVEPFVFDTASNYPQKGDYFQVMENNINRLLSSCCGTTIEDR